MRRIVTIILLAALSTALLACAGDPAGPASPEELTGVVVDIEASGIEDIESFTLRSDGADYEIHIAQDVTYGFPLSHLNAHRQQAEPVHVRIEDRDGKLTALSIEDA